MLPFFKKKPNVRQIFYFCSSIFENFRATRDFLHLRLLFYCFFMFLGLKITIFNLFLYYNIDFPVVRISLRPLQYSMCQHDELWRVLNTIWPWIILGYILVVFYSSFSSIFSLIVIYWSDLSLIWALSVIFQLFNSFIVHFEVLKANHTSKIA